MRFNDIEHVIQAIKTNNHYKLNKWEEDFIASIEGSILNDVDLTARQRKVVMNIYRKCYF